MEMLKDLLELKTAKAQSQVNESAADIKEYVEKAINKSVDSKYQTAVKGIVEKAIATGSTGSVKNAEKRLNGSLEMGKASFDLDDEKKAKVWATFVAWRAIVEFKKGIVSPEAKKLKTLKNFNSL